MSEPDRDLLRSHTITTAELLGIDLAEEEIEPVLEQVVRVAGLVAQLDRIDDDRITPAPRFRAGPPAGGPQVGGP